MKISAQEEYGLRCLVQLATLKDGESLTLPQIAEREGISVANTGKLMWLLNKAGFVQSTRGTKGGYFLARPAGEVFLNEVIKVLEEDEIDKHCDNYKGVLDSFRLTDGSEKKSIFREPHSWSVFELFKVKQGVITSIEAIFIAVPYNLRSPWTGLPWRRGV